MEENICKPHIYMYIYIYLHLLFMLLVSYPRNHCQEHCQGTLFLCFLLGVCGGEGNGTPLQCSCLENPMDGGAWWAAVHGVARSRTRLSDFTFIFHFHALEKEMATHSSVLAWRIPGTGSLMGCRPWGCTESDTTEVT